MKEWLTGRLAWMDDATASLATLPPEFSHPGGIVSRGFELMVTAEEGEIYYTLNGPDPKGAANQIAPEAILYTGPIVINENTRVRARGLKDGLLWSGMITATYATDIPPLVVSEIMYDPPDFPEDTSAGTARYEYLEFYNAGDEPVDLTGVRVMRRSGGSLRQSFDFAANDFTSLGAGEYVVVARDDKLFRERYGDEPVVAGEMSGSLSNSQGTVVVLGALDETFIDIRYVGEWYPSTDGDVGHSLVLLDPNSDRATWSDAEAWRPSHEVGGSPGAEDIPPPEGLQLRGDLDQDGRVGISDVVGILRYYVGEVPGPCEEEEGNTAVLDTTGEGFVNISDALHVVVYLFLGGEPRNLSPVCVSIRRCPDICGGTE